MGGETVTDATFKLHGQSSWVQTVMFDGERPKMQFDISFHRARSEGERSTASASWCSTCRASDWTFMHDRLAHAWFRQVGIAAGCAANARVEINGAYYGLFVAKETTSKRVIAEFFPDNPDGDLWKAGVQPETNNEAPNWSRQMAFTQATDIAAVVGDRRPGFLGQGMGGRGVDQQRRRLLRRQPQLLHLRHGREGVRVPPQRHRLDASTG